MSGVLLAIDMLREFLGAYRYRYESEAELRDAIADALAEIGESFVREYALGSAGRLDFMLEHGVALEVKTRGSRSDLVRQVMRYVEDLRVAGVLVLTTQLRHQLPPTMAGKPVRVLVVPRAFV